MENEVHEQFGDFTIELMGQGFQVAPTNPPASSGCGSCGGSCS